MNDIEKAITDLQGQIITLRAEMNVYNLVLMSTIDFLREKHPDAAREIIGRIPKIWLPDAVPKVDPSIDPLDPLLVAQQVALDDIREKLLREFRIEP